LGALQNTQNEEESSDLEKMEGFGCWKSQMPFEREAKAMERIERTASSLRKAHKRDRTGSGCDKRVFEDRELIIE
jgi:hypothetical protein